jgi:uncharacterized protein (DUF2062 family)
MYIQGYLKMLLRIKMKKSFEKIINHIKNRLKEVFNSELTAKQIALNCTVGILIGLLIPMGLQTIAVIFVCGLFKLNIVIVVFATLITNPFTVVFIYYSAFKIGNVFVNSGISWIYISEVLNNPKLDSILGLSFNSLKVIYMGLIIESLVFGTFTYIVMHQLANYILMKKK